MDYDNFRKRVKWLFDLALDSVTVTKLYESVLERGWNYRIYDVLFFHKQLDYERLHPTAEMREYEDYFNSHKEDIARCSSLLADGLSREVYRLSIEFRCAHNRRYLPPYDLTDQYFPEDIIHLSADEVFVDCGACRGDTYRRFSKECHNRYKRVICFEADENNASFLSKSAPNDDRLIVIPKGVWKEDAVLRFESLGLDWNGRFLREDEVSEGSKKSINEIPVCSIDSIECCQDATYIKMDIEGSEWEALHGAKNTIIRNKPKLAICLYHKPENT